MGKSNPSSRLGAEGSKKKSGIERDVDLPDIVPPLYTGKQIAAAPQKSSDTVIDMYSLISEEYTPSAREDRPNDHIDFSVAFGDEPEEFTVPVAENSPGEGDGTKKNTARKITAKLSNAPEQEITIFAFRLAIIEKTASMIGKLSFVWATIVLLGGFSKDISTTDFWVVTVIIVAESSRIFNRSHELEWQSLSSKSLGSRLLNSFKLKGRPVSMMRKLGAMPHSKKLDLPVVEASSTNPSPAALQPLTSALEAPQRRTWSKVNLPMIPFVGKLISTEDISTALYALQVMSATVCIGLSIWRLSQTPGDGTRQVLSLNIFYVLSVVEASLFLVEKCYWEYKFRIFKILDKVIAEANLGGENLEVVKEFYYDVYAKCLEESVFRGLEMDLVSYSISWLEGDDFTRQLAGARVLNRLVSGRSKPSQTRSATEVLRTIGTSPGILERLVEMLSWNSVQEKMLLNEIATIVCCLVVVNTNCSRIVAIPGSMDGFVSLLMSYNEQSPEQQKSMISYKPPQQLWLTGLSILKYLAKDPKNSLKIGDTPRLLAILVTFIEVRDESAFHSEYVPTHFKTRQKTYKKSLQLLGSLAAATNTPGKILRCKIADIPSGLKNLRDMMEYGHKYPELQRLAVKIISDLAVESDVRNRIGATGGVLRNLFELFAKYDSVRQSQSPPGLVEPQKEQKMREERILAAEEAGQALTRLVLQNENNCMKLLSLRDASSHETFIQVIVKTLSKPENIASSGARILRSVMQVADKKIRSEVARGSAPVVVDKIMSRVGTTKSEMYEACLGLASRTLGEVDSSAYREIVSSVDKLEFVRQLMRNLQHTPTTNKFPRIRRFSVELILAFIAKDDSFLHAFERTNIDLKERLERTLDSISEVENFCLFSGLSGYMRYDIEMENLVRQAIAAVDNHNNRSGTD